MDELGYSSFYSDYIKIPRIRIIWGNIIIKLTFYYFFASSIATEKLLVMAED